MNLSFIKDHQRTTLERAKELFDLDELGRLRWAPASGRQGLVTSKLKERCQYAAVTIDGHQFKVHRLVWLLGTGHWPQFVVDHINGDRHDNRLSNLRDVPHAINQRNQAYHRAGMTKAQWDSAARQRFIARRQPQVRRFIFEAEIEA